MIETRMLVSAVLIAVCTGGLARVQSAAAQTRDHFVKAGKTIPVGAGEFSLAVKRGPVNVFTYRPASFTPASPIWIVIHGQKRNARHGAFDYFDIWAPLAQKAGALLLVPEFDARSWPTSWQFQFGNVMTKSLKPIPWDDSGFAVVEMVFRRAIAMTGSHRQRFSIFGHGGGGQWVQRYVLHSGGRYIARAVAANPGWYMLPDDEFTYPYGIKGTPITPATLRGAFATDFLLLLGEDDVRSGGIMRNNKETSAQGKTRFARGHFYFNRAAADAKRLGTPFAWRLREVPGVGHSDQKMAPAAAEALMEHR